MLGVRRALHRIARKDGFVGGTCEDGPVIMNACGDRDGRRNERKHNGWARAENVGASGEGSNHIAVGGNNHMGAVKGATRQLSCDRRTGLPRSLIVRRQLSSYASRKDS